MLRKVALVTDADQGIGAEIIKTLGKRFDGAFYYTSRNLEKGALAAEEFRKLGYELEFHQFDVSDRSSIIRFRDHVLQNYSGIDTLINNVAIDNGVQECDTFEKAKKIVTDYYYNYVTIQELLFPLLLDNAKVVYVCKQTPLECVRNQYWLERLSMKYLREADVNDFLVWYLDALKRGTYNQDDIVEEGIVAPYRVANVALSLLVSLQRKEMQSRSISVNFLYPSWSFKTQTR